MSTVALAMLIEDFSIYPRHSVDDTHVARIVDALKSGATLPPIAVERKSCRIVDGWHRARAYRRVLGPESAVDVEEVDYPSETALVEDAIRRNSTHGRRLDRIDQARAYMLLQERGVTSACIAQILHVPEERLVKLSVRVAEAPSPGAGAVPGTTRVALKRPVAHLAGRTLTPGQMEAHARAPGVSYLMIVIQLRDAMGQGFINRDDERLMAALRLLQSDLRGFLAKTG